VSPICALDSSLNIKIAARRQTFFELTDADRSKLSHHGSAPRCSLADCPRVSQAEEPAARGDPERSHRKSGFSDTSRPARPNRRPTCRRNCTNAYRLVDTGDDAYRRFEVVGQSAHRLPIIQKAAMSGSSCVPSGAGARRSIRQDGHTHRSEEPRSKLRALLGKISQI